ncbi:MAG: hypothetical protein RLZZ488_2512 [Pseudomonadota bacterium]|jgi:translation initiation factor 1 (eIF-1/SUI1)
MTTQRKKPIKLELQGNLISSAPSDAVAVQIRGGESHGTTQPSATTASSAELKSGVVKLRREVKGRAGKPVSVLYDFSDPAGKNSSALRALQAKLKQTLACGGTCDEDSGEIILQVDDLQRVRQILERLGFTVKG